MSYFLNFGLPNLTILFTFLTCCFSQDNYIYNHEPDDHVKNEEIVFRVVNGQAASLGDVPYQVAFRSPVKSNVYSTFCGGTIVAEKKIISAAHCFYSKPISNCCNKGRAPKKKIMNMFAVAGTLKNKDFYRREDSYSHGQWRKLRSVYYPPHYEFPRHDIAVVFLYSSFVFNNYINQLPLASVRMEYNRDGISCLVSGYGRMSRYKTSPILYKATLAIIPTHKCNIIHRRNMRHFVCTSAAVADVHKGDSGGPLVCKNTGDPQEGSRGILVGVVSGNRRTRTGDGSFFTRVSSYRTYIKTQGSSCEFIMSNWLLILINSAFLLL